jgi:hypothetical protein
VTCHRCGHPLAAERIGVRDVCPRCAAWLHSCRNCDFYAPGHAHDCAEPNAEPVADKEQGNFCDYFRPRAAPAPAHDATPDAVRARLEALFKKRPPS